MLSLPSLVVRFLQHSSRLVLSRFQIGEKVDELVDTAWERYSCFINQKDILSRNKLISVVEGLLIECQPNANYAASTATSLLTDSKFLELASLMKTNDVWTDDLEKLMDVSLTLVLN